MIFLPFVGVCVSVCAHTKRQWNVSTVTATPLFGIGSERDKELLFLHGNQRAEMGQELKKWKRCLKQQSSL